MRKKYLFKIAGIEFTVYRLVMTFFFVALIIWGINSYRYQLNALNNFSYAMAKVTYLLNSQGTRISLSPVVIYEFTINGKVYNGREPAADGFSPNTGDCIIVKYSIEDPNVSEMSMQDGIVACD